ncbi:hypothetical protein TTRE_0000272601 [Trichuris trichiura]|uniref:Uncharacterized protein n=1 Tax=Trichuris trichiura TaxID=36087 RepID=A0A077Z340_TRITR|nr:hypothetical protein TTRE_0000272601 [Trichuris trichiura]
MPCNRIPLMARRWSPRWRQPFCSAKPPETIDLTMTPVLRPPAITTPRLDVTFRNVILWISVHSP